MKIVIYSVVLNQHQAPVADELWEQTDHQFCFVETINLGDMKGGADDYSARPYLLQAWQSKETHDKALNLAQTAECCIFSGIDSLPYEKARLRLGLLSFDMSERWLKRGWKSFASPRLIKWLLAYYFGGWKHKPLYKLCMSAFAADDHRRMGTFIGKCYKWGYFTKVDNIDVETSASDVSTSDSTPLMLCARYLMLKHPEMPIFMAYRLRNKGYKFHLKMFGDGERFNATKALASSLQLNDYVTFYGNVPNNIVRTEMKTSDIFLFTSDRYEGWGAVANESLSCGCALVGSDAIGSVPYLVEDGFNGFKFKNCDVEDLTQKVEYLLNHKDELRQMQRNAYYRMHNIWSPNNATLSLLQLIDDLSKGLESSIMTGPCSKA